MTDFTLQLTHYSDRGGILSLDPQAGSTSPDGNGAEKKRAAQPDFRPRWYAYTDSYSAEARIANRKYKYITTIDSRLLYDIELDPNGYRKYGSYADPTFLENCIAEDGFDGYFSVNYGIAALFISLQCEQIAHERDLFAPTQDR